MKLTWWNAEIQFVQDISDPIRCNIDYFIDVPLVGELGHRVTLLPMTESEAITYLDKLMRSQLHGLKVKVVILYTPGEAKFYCLESFIETFTPAIKAKSREVM